MLWSPPLPFIPYGNLPALHWRNHEPRLSTYIDSPDKMKLAFGIATVKTMDPWSNTILYTYVEMILSLISLKLIGHYHHNFLHFVTQVQK